MGKKILGLDLGITSLGSSILEEVDKNSYRIIDSFTMMRDAPYDIKSGESSQKQRSTQKSQRSLNEKRKRRVKNVARVFDAFNLLNFDSCMQVQKENKITDKWRLRAKDALNCKLSSEELFAIMAHMAKHRGYKSIATEDLLYELELELGLIDPINTDEAKADEKRQVYAALNRVEELKGVYPHETIAQVIHRAVQEGRLNSYRNHDNYEKMIRREDIEDEIETIVKKQFDYGLFDDAQKAQGLIEALQEAITDQVMPENDPALFGKCSFYTNEIAAPKYSYLYDIYRLYKTLADLRIDNYTVTQEEREKIVEYVNEKISSGKNIKQLTYKEVRKILSLDTSCKIFGKEDESIIKGKSVPRTLVKFFFLEKIKDFPKTMQSIAKHPEALSIFAELAEILQQEKTPKPSFNRIKTLFEKNDIAVNKKEILAMIKGYTAGTLSISHKFIIDALPHFAEGKDEKEVQDILGIATSEDYSRFPKSLKHLHLGKENLFERKQNNINNHAVKSLASWVLGIIADLSWKYGVFDEIIIESARDALPKSIKKEIEKGMREKEKELNKIIEAYKKEFPSVNRKMARKIKLLESQKYMDIYTGKIINISDLFEGRADIEHIVPRSLGGLSADYNLVIAHRDANIQKSNRLPMDWLGGDSEYVNRVERLFAEHLINWKKRKNLLATSMDEMYNEVQDSKALRATSYLEALVAENLKIFYPFADKEKRKNGTGVRNVPGKTTSRARRVLGIKSKSRDTNWHHAEDALILATLSRGWQNRLHRMLKDNYGKSEADLQEVWQKFTPHLEGMAIADYIKESYERFMSLGENSLWYRDMFGKRRSVSYWVNRKPLSTSSHKDTVYSGRHEVPTLRKSIIAAFEGLNLIQNRNKLNSDKFMKQYEKEIRSKLWYVHSGNTNDPIMRAIDERAKRIVQLIDSYILKDPLHDNEVGEAYKAELSALISEPIVVDDKMVRRVRFVYESYKTKVYPIDRGLVETDKNMLGIFVQKGAKKLTISRMDVNNAHELEKSPNGMRIYLNEMIYLFNKKKLMHYGCLRGYSVNNQGAKYIKLFNPRFPSNPSSQPEFFSKKSGIRDISVGSATGIIKVHLAPNGQIRSYQKFGTISKELEEVFKKECGYGNLENNTHH
ncbi:MAG: type II CRISPR RNA-guided endonuclease Cas9 [Sulfurovum sp.]|nr:type II CRISPR RNA-guided endonuclease Cas9 [Sulfurovum sp.]